MPAGSGPLPWLDRRWYEARPTTAEAEAFCRDLAGRHYENFTVVSFLLPRPLRQHFANVYAYCRISDDLADELEAGEVALARLDEWGRHLDACYAGEARHPVFVALSETIRRFDVPKEPFADLLVAFRRDQIQTRYPTWNDLLGYCRNSANPVGRLVLYLCGYRDPERQRLSDATCTALQLANFWQDVARDFARGRVYVPLDLLAAFGSSEERIARRECDAQWRRLMRDLVARTRTLFDQGAALERMLQGRVRLAVELFARGGREVLRAIEQDCGYDTLSRRPEVGRTRKLALAGGALLRAGARAGALR